MNCIGWNRGLPALAVLLLLLNTAGGGCGTVVNNPGDGSDEPDPTERNGKDLPKNQLPNAGVPGGGKSTSSPVETDSEHVPVTPDKHTPPAWSSVEACQSFEWQAQSPTIMGEANSLFLVRLEQNQRNEHPETPVSLFYQLFRLDGKLLSAFSGIELPQARFVLDPNIPSFVIIVSKRQAEETTPLCYLQTSMPASPFYPQGSLWWLQIGAF